MPYLHNCGCVTEVESGNEPFILRHQPVYCNDVHLHMEQNRGRMWKGDSDWFTDFLKSHYSNNFTHIDRQDDLDDIVFMCDIIDHPNGTFKGSDVHSLLDKMMCRYVTFILEQPMTEKHRYTGQRLLKTYKDNQHQFMFD